jgi:hypothetical protein
VPIRISELLWAQHRVHQVGERDHAEHETQNRHHHLQAIAQIDERDHCDECRNPQQHQSEREQHDLLPGRPPVTAFGAARPDADDRVAAKPVRFVSSG